MSRITRNPKRDANEKAIAAALERIGCAVIPLSRVGCPDLIVFRPDGSAVLVEVKSKTGKLTSAQMRWRETWRGPYPWIVRSVEDAIALCQP